LPLSPLPGWAALALIPLLALQLLFTLGLGIFLGTLNVFFRDVGQLTGVVLQFWFWLTPIVYTLRRCRRACVAGCNTTPCSR